MPERSLCVSIHAELAGWRRRIAEPTYPRWNRSNTPSAYTLTGLPAGGGFVLYPAGCVSLPIGGGAIVAEPLPPLPAALLLALALLLSLAAEDFRLPLRATLSAMSTLASVVSLGSPGSTTWGEATAGWSELARWRLLGGWLLPPAAESVFLWVAAAVPVVRPDSGAVVSPSSAEASRDSVWMIWFRSISSVLLAVLLRLRFPAALFCDDGLGDAMLGMNERGTTCKSGRPGRDGEVGSR